MAATQAISEKSKLKATGKNLSMRLSILDEAAETSGIDNRMASQGHADQGRHKDTDGEDGKVVESHVTVGQHPLSGALTIKVLPPQPNRRGHYRI